MIPETDAPVTESVSNQADYERVAARASLMLAGVTRLNYPALYAELSGYNVTLTESPSLDTVCRDLQTVQGLRDRVAKLVEDSTRVAVLYRRTADILQKGWMVMSEAKSDGKREGESVLKASQFIMAAAEADAFLKTAQHVLFNLDAKHDTLAEQLKCYAIMAKLRDVRLMGAPVESDRQAETFTDWDKFDRKSGDTF